MTLELTEKEANLILKGLGELPAKESIDMIMKIKVMWAEQEEKKKAETAVS